MAKTAFFPMLKPSTPFGQGDWVLSMKTLDGAGRLMGNGAIFDFNALSQRCPGLITRNHFPDPAAVQACAQRIGLHVVDRYQPGSRYWMFQGIETGLFVVLAVGMVLLATWWVRHRVA